LSGIDVPITGTRGLALIESAFGAQPLSVLIDVARDLTEDPGIRLRAYRAIGLYPTTEARLALTADLDILSGSGLGTDLLYLRAAIEALGEQGEPNDVATLVPLLDFEASRDIRAATADALRNIGSSTATGPLHDRLGTWPIGHPLEGMQKETSAQVRLAIARALRELGDTP
jgi:HEAT repeat protein